MTKKKSTYDNTRALSALVLAGDPDAIAHVVSAVKTAAGSMRGGAGDLGIPERTLWGWREASKPLAAALRKFGRRSGPARK